MPANETIIAVPLGVEQTGQTRQFLVRLIEKLDIVLGYRGNDPYVALSQLESLATTDNLTVLEQAVLTVINNLLAADGEVTNGLIDALSESTDTAIAALKSASTVSDGDATKPTLTNPPTQGELQAMQDQIGDNASLFNDLLTALRGTEIIAT